MVVVVVAAVVKKGSAGGGSGGDGEVLFFLTFNFNLFLMAKSSPGGPGSFFARSPAVRFLPLSSSRSNDPTIGSSASNVDISSYTSSSGFCCLKIFFFIWFNFCL